MFPYKEVAMKCPSYEATRASNLEKSSAAESKVLHLKSSPRKETTPIKPQCPPAEVTNIITGAVHDKENSTSREHYRSLDEVFDDSGYLSLQNSQIDDNHGEEEEYIQNKPAALHSPGASHHEKTIKSPSKRQTNRCIVPQVAGSTPVDCQRRKASTYSLSSTPRDKYSDPNLPILKFQRAVCEKLSKSYQKNKRYDWTIPSQVAEDHLLDRVIGGHMGLEYVDVFSTLLSRGMKCILTKILALLSDLDLISCKKVSRTWRKIICEDKAALSRCQNAKQVLREPWRGCGLTRDAAVSRLVLSSMQSLASSSGPSTSFPSSSSSTLSCKVSRWTGSSQRSSTPTSHCTRFNDFMQVANSLKQHESLRSCKRCGSPSTYSPEAQRATCTRLSCQFDFCTHCQQAFHGSTPCKEVQPRAHFTSSKSTQIFPGSARSKRNIRRL